MRDTVCIGRRRLLTGLAATSLISWVPTALSVGNSSEDVIKQKTTLFALLLSVDYARFNAMLPAGFEISERPLRLTAAAKQTLGPDGVLGPLFLTTGVTAKAIHSDTFQEGSLTLRQWSSDPGSGLWTGLTSGPHIKRGMVAIDGAAPGTKTVTVAERGSELFRFSAHIGNAMDSASWAFSGWNVWQFLGPSAKDAKVRTVMFNANVSDYREVSNGSFSISEQGRTDPVLAGLVDAQISSAWHISYNSEFVGPPRVQQLDG